MSSTLTHRPAIRESWRVVIDASTHKSQSHMTTRDRETIEPHTHTHTQTLADYGEDQLRREKNSDLGSPPRSLQVCLIGRLCATDCSPRPTTHMVQYIRSAVQQSLSPCATDSSADSFD
mmetsp:Transcript_21595/g.52915  ORF Transcript_21595/g.52915 Transcript_21595/m.52915 type:complete len:119 (-) Transcript_21595:264-620(-)